MSSTAEMIEVSCPNCGKLYAGWERILMAAFDESLCPYCGLDPATDRLLHEDGVFVAGGEEEDAPAI